MKKLLFALLLITIKAHTQTYIYPYLNLQAGYVSDHYTHLDWSAGMEVRRDGQQLYPIAEVGGKFQLTEDKVAQVGVADIGLEYSTQKIFFSGSGGVGYVFNLPTIDRYKPNDSTQITISDGYTKSSYLSPYIGFKAGMYINGVNSVPVFIDVSYVGKLVWYGAGVKITF